ncbi:hypothetical protein ACET3Z_005188 [Daucus carota]
MAKYAALSLFLYSILVAHSTTLNKGVSAASDTCEFPAIFNFGDANSDTGAFATMFTSRPPTFGQSFFGGNAGRPSDGRLIIDFLASSLGLPFLHPYLDSFGANFSHGANFANILSTIALPTTNIIPAARRPRGTNPVSLDIQIAQFAQFVTRSQTQGKKFKKLMPKKEYFAKALYTLDIGQVDLSDQIFDHKTDDEIKAILPDLISTLSSNIKSLYSLGGRTFWIHNTGPLGCLPILLTVAPVADDQLDSAGCAKRYNDLAQYFNNLLKKGVDQLRKDLPLAAFTYVDVYSAKYSLYQEPKKYGFTHPLESCCGYGGKYKFEENSLCGSTIIVNGTQFVVEPCERPAEYINYEGVTYTEAADRITSARISSGKFSHPPNSLRAACQK